MNIVYWFILVVKYFHENAPKILLQTNIFMNNPLGQKEKCGGTFVKLIIKNYESAK